MKNFEFKSQICTTREQSEKLLAAGLKKETADMEIEIFKGDNTISGCVSKGYWENEISNALIEIIPAWSLHRLMEIGEMRDIDFSDISKAYDTAVRIIKCRIHAGLINPEYLEEQK